MAYCLLGYLCGYYRYYYPLEFITAYLNDAANDDDVRAGTAYAEKIGIRVTMPKWGISRAEYAFDREKRIIAKGLASVKYMSASIAKELLKLSKENTYETFVDLLRDINEKTPVNTRQLDILIKLDFFSDFGNQRELLNITEMFFDKFKGGDIKQLKKDSVAGTAFQPIIEKYSIGVTKSGAEAKSYTFVDVWQTLRECEGLIKSVGMEDLPYIVKAKNFEEAMGYFGFFTMDPKDRRKLYVTEIKPLFRKADQKQFGYSVYTKSVGSGVEARFTLFNRYLKQPINKGDIIECLDFERDGQYFRLLAYRHVYM